MNPIIEVYDDKLRLNHAAALLGMELYKTGRGAYTVTKTPQLATQGWSVDTPLDQHGKKLFYLAARQIEVDGLFYLKIECAEMLYEDGKPQAGAPMDIPDGRWIDFRFNECGSSAYEKPFTVQAIDLG